MNEPIPSFEGRPVEGITVKVSGSAPLEDLNDTVLSIDDRVQLVAVYTVTGVHHQVDKATGNLIRVQTIKPAEMHLLPFNENDPSDDGVIRALPQYTSRQAVTASAGSDPEEGDDEA